MYFYFIFYSKHKPQSSLTPCRLSSAHRRRNIPAPKKRNRETPAEPLGTPAAPHLPPTCPACRGRVLDLRHGGTGLTHHLIRLKRWSSGVLLLEHLEVWTASLGLLSLGFQPSGLLDPCAISPWASRPEEPAPRSPPPRVRRRPRCWPAGGRIRSSSSTWTGSRDSRCVWGGATPKNRLSIHQKVIFSSIHT